LRHVGVSLLFWACAKDYYFFGHSLVLDSVIKIHELLTATFPSFRGSMG
jgi:hypothetical protein